jgi:hypothetical protein
MKPYRRRELLAELGLAWHTLSATTLNIAEIYAGMRAARQNPQANSFKL